MALPNTQAAFVSVDPQAAGTASGLGGFLQMGLAAVVAQIVGSIQDGTPYPMAIGMSLCAAAALISALVAIRVATGDAQEPDQRRAVQLALHVRIDPAQQEADIVDHHLAVVGLEIGVDRQDLEHHAARFAPDPMDRRAARASRARCSLRLRGRHGIVPARRDAREPDGGRRAARTPSARPAGDRGRRRRWWRR